MYSSGSLTISGCTIRNNTAVGGRGSDGANFYNGFIEPGSHSPVAGQPGGDAHGGGVCIAGGTADITGTTVEQNVAKGGVGGKGMKWRPNGAAGLGIGGGLFIAAAASVGLDAFTVDHVKRNNASSSGPNIAGSYVVIL